MLASENESPPTRVDPSTFQRSEPSFIIIPEVSVTSRLGRPVPLKTILRPPASLGAKKPVVSSLTVLPSFARDPFQMQTNEFSSAPTVITFTSQPHTTLTGQHQTTFTGQLQTTSTDQPQTAYTGQSQMVSLQELRALFGAGELLHNIFYSNARIPHGRRWLSPPAYVELYTHCILWD